MLHVCSKYNQAEGGPSIYLPAVSGVKKERLTVSRPLGQMELHVNLKFIENIKLEK
jgi:hypothetical protein